MKALLTYLAGILLSFFFFLNVANAQTPGRTCASNESFSIALATEFGEFPTARMVQQGTGVLILLYTNKKTGTWTLARVIPQQPKITCIVISGNGYIERKKDAINDYKFGVFNNDLQRWSISTRSGT